MNGCKRAMGKKIIRNEENGDNYYCCLNRHYLFHDVAEFSNFSDEDDDFNDALCE